MDWLACWKENNIGFHRHTTNPLLEQYCPSLQLPPGSTVLVPLCGKSLDMLWLISQGYQIIGVELSAIACEAFFQENHLDFSIEKTALFTIYRHPAITLYCGDFFNLSPAMIPEIKAVYDRAALIALPPPLRQRYSQHLAQLMSSGEILLIAIDSDDSVTGPPYVVKSAEVKQLFAPTFVINELARVAYPEINSQLQNKGYRSITEVVYRLTKSPQMTN